MHALLIISLLIGCLAPFLFVFLKIKADGPIATIGKTFASFCFVLLAILLSFYRENLSVYGLLVTLALMFGLFGDVFLDLQDPNKKCDSPFLFGGIGAFSIEHILMIFAVCSLLKTGFRTPLLLLSVGFGLIFAFAAGYVEKKVLKFEFGKSFFVILAYSAILATGFAMYLTSSIVDKKFLILFTGMILFLISDCVLSVMYFNGKNKNAYLLLINIASYYFGQIFFALSVLYV